MRAAAVAPARLRRRLAIAFVLTAGVSTAALAIGSYVIVRSSRLDDSAVRAVSQSTFNLRFAAGQTSAGSLLDAYRTRGDFCAIVVPAAGPPLRDLSCPTLTQVPSDLRRLVAAGQLARQRVTIAGRHELVVGGRLANGTTLYFFYDEQQLWDDLGTLRDVLALGWLALTLLAGLIGTLLARRTLAPVSAASQAARSLAEGLLDTRLPVAGDDEFGAWAASFNEMAEALESKIAALSDAQQRERAFTANVAHELRTPLTALVGEAELLAEHAAAMPEEPGRLARLLVADVGRLRRLTEDLLEISRIDSGQERTATQLLNAGQVVAGVLRGNGWSDRVELDADDLVLLTDRRRLERIVANLVGNAIAHGGAAIVVRVTRDGGVALVEVADDGPGLAPDFLPHVFDRFSKADRNRSESGSGLGLAIARENARLLGGDLAAGNRPGGGALFSLWLPVSETLHAGEESVAQPAQDGDAHPSTEEE
ncbi:MAG: two-component system, OmpR family, sensor histidine kinase MtrB [Gaiellales bacterium]|nr:two-component system, OmpR family, sensor histidine kinase MtrB [Gaiellales bacterium]